MTPRPDAVPRIVFMGTPAFAVPSLEACRDLGQVVMVLTQPDRPQGRGQDIQGGAVKQAAEAAGLPLMQPPRLKGTDVAARLAALSPDVCVVTAYGRILPPDVLSVAKQGCVNVHGSLLPRWRGAAPIQWAVAEGDAETGITLMKLDEGLDTGPIFAQARTPIRPEDTSESLRERLAVLGADLLRQKLPGYLAGTVILQSQPAEGVTLAPPLTKEQGELDFRLPARVLERRIRAFTPWPAAYASWGGKRLKVLAAEARPSASGAPDPATDDPAPDGSAVSGTVVAVGGGVLEVACGAGVLRLLRVQPEGKRAMSAAEFLAGRPVVVGERPFAPVESRQA